MKFIGNYNHWIKSEWLDFLHTERGIGRPNEGKKPNTEYAIYEQERSKKSGYDLDKTHFYQFNVENFPFEVNPPFIDVQFNWWIIKMLPGNFVPMHVDPHTIYEKNPIRYWMPLQDWESGHIFMYENFVITDYKAGDVYEWNEAIAVHGSCNIGHSTRLAFQFCTNSKV